MPTPNITEYLNQWEETYKKGLLTFWLLLLLQQRPSYSYEMKEALVALSQGTISADENSIYRALKRFAEAGLVKSEQRPSDIGPDRRYFSLSAAGRTLLEKFTQRNILVFQAPEVVAALRQLSQN